MLYATAQDWISAPRKSVLFFAMSGLGKTYLSKILSGAGSWFHYSIDYRIGTRYMAEPIADNLKAEAMKIPFLREMLRQDAIHISANVHDDDLTAVSAFLGKPGDPAQGGLPMHEYRRRQALFQEAECAALRDTPHFRDRGHDLYGYDHFICDTGGSICEWVDPNDPDDPVLRILAKTCLMIWIEGDAAHTQSLIKRFDDAPKPMAYQPKFLENSWAEYLDTHACREDAVDPDAFVRWTYARALAHRQPLYEAIARNWGIRIKANRLAALKNEAEFIDIVAAAIEEQRAR